MRKKMVILWFCIWLIVLCLGCSTSELPDKGMAILSPMVNHVVPAGASTEIQWKAEVPDAEFGAMVTIEFSKNNGKSWEMVEDNVPKAGKYSWKVPKIDSTQCKIRVFSQRRPEYRGTSGVFVVK